MASEKNYVNIEGPNGSNSAPSYSFHLDPNTGMYSASADTIGFATNGTLRLSIGTASITSTLVMIGPAGTAGAPTYSFSPDTTSGIYQASAGRVDFSAGSTNIATVSGQGLQVSSGWLATTGAFLGVGLFSQPPAATDIPIVAKGRASQSANLQEWQNSSGTVLASVTSAGAFNASSQIVIDSNFDVEVMYWMGVNP